ncbi:MAG: potassium-transporting ATPase subunit KdpA [Arsenophonus sp.]
MNYKYYLLRLLLLNVIGIIFLLLINQQNVLLNPKNFVNLNQDLALNTGICFITNTN